MTTYISNCLVC